MTIGPMPVCYHCKHQSPDHPRSCAAFETIPDAIFFEGNPHTEPVDGDNGIRFEPKEDDK